MYEIRASNRFKKQAKLCARSGCDMDLLERVMDILARKGSLPAAYRAHKLSGDYAGLWESHIKGDWLLI